MRWQLESPEELVSPGTASISAQSSIRDVERVLGHSALAKRLLQLGHAFRQLLLLMIELQEHPNLGHEDP
jgi:hypothetical protein